MSDMCCGRVIDTVVVEVKVQKWDVPSLVYNGQMSGSRTAVNFSVCYTPGPVYCLLFTVYCLLFTVYYLDPSVQQTSSPEDTDADQPNPDEREEIQLHLPI